MLLDGAGGCLSGLHAGVWLEAALVLLGLVHVALRRAFFDAAHAVALSHLLICLVGFPEDGLVAQGAGSLELYSTD